MKENIGKAACGTGTRHQSICGMGGRGERVRNELRAPDGVGGVKGGSNGASSTTRIGAGPTDSIGDGIGSSSADDGSPFPFLPLRSERRKAPQADHLDEWAAWLVSVELLIVESVFRSVGESGVDFLGTLRTS